MAKFHLRRVAGLCTVSVMLCLSCLGCCMCDNPFDDYYTAHGGVRPRVDMTRGRAGSAFADATQGYYAEVMGNEEFAEDYPFESSAQPFAFPDAWSEAPNDSILQDGTDQRLLQEEPWSGNELIPAPSSADDQIWLNEP